MHFVNVRRHAAGSSGRLSSQISELRGDISQFLLEIELALLECHLPVGCRVLVTRVRSGPMAAATARPSTATLSAAPRPSLDIVSLHRSHGFLASLGFDVTAR